MERLVNAYRTYGLQGELNLASLTLDMPIKNEAGIQIKGRLLVPGIFGQGGLEFNLNSARVQSRDNKGVSEPIDEITVSPTRLAQTVGAFEKDYGEGRYVDWKSVRVTKELGNNLHPDVVKEVFDRRVYNEEGREIGFYIMTGSAVGREDLRDKTVHYSVQPRPNVHMKAMGTDLVIIGNKAYYGIWGPEGLVGYVEKEYAKIRTPKVFDAHGTAIGIKDGSTLQFYIPPKERKLMDHLGSGVRSLPDKTGVVPLFGDAAETELLGYAHPIPLVEKLEIPTMTKGRIRGMGGEVKPPARNREDRGSFRRRRGRFGA